MNQLKNVHYFPGHMKKALATLGPYFKASDLIVEVADARAPHSTRNPALSVLSGNKPRLLLLSKADRADSKVTEEWIAYYAKQGLTAFSADLKKEKLLNVLTKMSETLVAAKRAKETRIGMKKQPLRLAIAGIPNVGKSTLINNLAGRNVVKAANTPGVTRSEQWINLSGDFVLLDTPGILPMNYPDGSEAVRLALLGSIKEEVLPNEELADALIGYLQEEYPHSLKERFGIEDLRELDSDSILIKVAERRGYLAQGGSYDLSKAVKGLLKDFEDGILGNYSLERPD